MVELSGRSPGVSAREIDLTGPQNVTPVGVPAGIIGTADRGPAFVPVTVGSIKDFVTKFGTSDGSRFGPLAVAEWLRSSQAVTYLRVLGVGKGLKRETSGNNAGKVDSAGFVVGSKLPQDDGFLGENPYATSGGPLGRTHLLACFMSESAGSTIFSDAGIQESGLNMAAPILRAILTAPSGVVPMLGTGTSVAAASVASVSDASGPTGALTGTVDLSGGNQNFVLHLNGHKNSDPSFPNIITASFDQTAPNYFGNVLNSDPFKIQQAGHYLYTKYDIHPSQAVVTGVGIAVGTTADERIAVLTTGTLARNLGSSVVPNFENFEDRYQTPASPSVISQKFGGNYRDLFRVHALSDGAEANDNFKISIQNIAKSTVNDSSYGTFDLLVRAYDDNDENKIILESYFGLTLDPSSENYIARRIGDFHAYYDWDKNVSSQKLVVEGKFPNKSNLIRVEVSQEVDNSEIDASALPIGFRGPQHLITSGTHPVTSIDADSTYLTTAGQDAIKRLVEPPVPFRDNIAGGVDPKKIANKQLYWGVQFEQKTSVGEPNKSRIENETIRAMTRYLPNFHTTFQNVAVGENAGAVDVAGTVLDSDRFNNNLFSLDRIRIRTGSNQTLDAKEIVSMSYVRNGLIAENAVNKTRALDVALDFGDQTVRTLAKFSFFVQGGFDGTGIFNRETVDMSDAAAKQEMDDAARGQNEGPTVKAFDRALDIMGNVSDVDIKLLAIPGIRQSVITDKGIDVSESDRFDALYIMDVEERDNLNQAVTSSLQTVNVKNTVNAFSARGLNSNFAAAYFPDVIVNNVFNNLNAQVPPSVAILGAFSLNDSISFPWFAPAGFSRGALKSTDRVALQLNRTNLDSLQDVDINPIVSFPDSAGPVVWGQKTLQAAQSALDRVNVRRLLIEIRRRIRRIGESLLFEPNRETTLERFSNQANPVLQRIQEQQGINRFLVQIDTTTTTEADILNNTIRGKIYVEPTRTAEFVSLDFVVQNPGSLS